MEELGFSKMQQRTAMYSRLSVSFLEVTFFKEKVTNIFN